MRYHSLRGRARWNAQACVKTKPPITIPMEYVFGKKPGSNNQGSVIPSPPGD